MKLFGKWRKEESSEPKEETAFAATASAEKPSQDAIGKNRTILVVDDNAVVLKAFELKLRASGFQVLTATEGAAAVSVARQAKPDIIVLDINFPPDVGSSGLQWDGFNIMTWLRRFQEVATIPVIIISSGEPSKYKQRSLDAGAVAFFQKPINYEEFMVEVRRAFGQGGGPGQSAAKSPRVSA
jgi:two-component system, OmpR family, KDP operon response regulator KdpE